MVMVWSVLFSEKSEEKFKENEKENCWFGYATRVNYSNASRQLTAEENFGLKTSAVSCRGNLKFFVFCFFLFFENIPRSLSFLIDFS